MTTTDDANRQVQIPRAPQRIVSIAPSNTEILFALGLGDRIVDLPIIRHSESGRPVILLPAAGRARGAVGERSRAATQLHQAEGGG